MRNMKIKLSHRHIQLCSNSSIQHKMIITMYCVEKFSIYKRTDKRVLEQSISVATIPRTFSFREVLCASRARLSKSKQIRGFTAGRHSRMHMHIRDYNTQTPIDDITICTQNTHTVYEYLYACAHMSVRMCVAVQHTSKRADLFNDCICTSSNVKSLKYSPFQ